MSHLLEVAAVLSLSLLHDVWNMSVFLYHSLCEFPMF